MEVYKKTEYTNIPIALSHLHIKEYTNILKRKDKTSRRTSSESNTKSTQPFIIITNQPTANIHMFRLEADV